MKTRYTRSLEMEVARLRAENRALLNSILGIAGMPPITVPIPNEGSESGERTCGDNLPSGSAAECARNVRRTNPAARVPVRKRTWYQINRSLEIEEARKKTREAAEAPDLGIAVQRS